MLAILAMALLEGNGTLESFLVLAAAFRFMPAGAFEDFSAIFAEFKISQDILGFTPCKVCGDKVYIFFGSQFFILRTAVGAVRHDRHYFSLFFHAHAFLENSEDNKNSVFLDVYISRPPVFRRTPLGHKITELTVVINYSSPESDYIPCICWNENENALATSLFPCETHIHARGKM